MSRPDLRLLPDSSLLVMVGRHLKASMTHTVGTPLWAEAVRAHADCQRELDRRLLIRIVRATGGSAEDISDEDEPGDSI